MCSGREYFLCYCTLSPSTFFLCCEISSCILEDFPHGLSLLKKQHSIFKAFVWNPFSIFASLVFLYHYRACFLTQYILNDPKNSFRYRDIASICYENSGLFEEMTLLRKEVLNSGFLYKGTFFASLCTKSIIKLQCY